jgi:hypothetical protein
MFWTQHTSRSYAKMQVYLQMFVVKNVAVRFIVISRVHLCLINM